MPARYTTEQRLEMIDRIRRLPEQLTETVSGLTLGELTTHYLPQEWTVAQNVHHVADAHARLERVSRVILNERATHCQLVEHEQLEFVESHRLCDLVKLHTHTRTSQSHITHTRTTHTLTFSVCI